MYTISHISKSYQKKPILQDVSFALKPGTCAGILGSNGSGKSTLLQILSGVIRPDLGDFLLEDHSLLKDRKTLPQKVGYVPQQDTLMEELSGYDNLRLWYSREQIRNACLPGGILSLLGVDTFMQKRVSKMSGGMKKRVSIACAVLGNPGLLLLDEPSAGLDIPCKEKIYEHYRSFQQAGGTILLVTHDLQELQLCDETFLLRDGSLRPYHYNGVFGDLAKELM